MNVDDIVAERIAEARRRIEANKRRRAALAAARQRGLAFRHAAKLRNLARSRQDPAVVRDSLSPAVAADIVSAADETPVTVSLTDADPAVVVVSLTTTNDPEKETP